LKKNQKMKKYIVLLFVCISTLSSAQAIQVQNIASALRNKELDKGKIAADAAAINETTKNSAKMWMYRGKVYMAIFQSTVEAEQKLDNEAEEKALDAFVNCLRIDAKDSIYKDEVKGALVVSAAATSNKANFYRQNKTYDKALYCYDLLESALPFDFTQGMKRKNITREKLIYNKFELFKFSGNQEKTKEYANKLFDIKYKDPRVYIDMVNLSLLEKDTVSALTYIEKGKVMFEDNIDLIATELDIYLARKKTNVLKDKVTAALAVSPDNEVLHFVLANIYKSTGAFADAEKEYLKALELKSDYEPAVYNIGVLYYSQGKEFNDKLGALPPKDPKTKEYETKTAEYFKKAVGYFESSYEVTKDAKTKKILKQLFTRLGDGEKAEKYK
jgi:tetratricopeptide (TPR) repeat protein